MTQTIPIEVTVNGRAARARGRRPPHPARRPARRPRPDRHQGVLPGRRVRGLHRHASTGAIVDSCLVLAVEADGGRGHHGRGARRRRAAQPAAAGVPRHGRRPVRLLHPGPAHGGPRPAGAEPAPHRGRDPGGPGRQPLPLRRATSRSPRRSWRPPRRPTDEHACDRRLAGPGRRRRAGHRRPAVRGRHPPGRRAPREARHARLRACPDRLDRHERRRAGARRPPGHDRGRPAPAGAALRAPVRGPPGPGGRRDQVPRRARGGGGRRHEGRRRGGRHAW